MTQEQQRLEGVEHRLTELTSSVGRTVDGCLKLTEIVKLLAGQIEQQQNLLKWLLDQQPQPSSPYPRERYGVTETIQGQQSSDVTVQSVKSSQ